MALSFGALSSFVAGDSALSNSLTLVPSLRLPPQTTHLRTATFAAASKATTAATTTGNREPRGIMKPKRVSPEMQNLLGVSEIPRTQALKQIWAYIKDHNLQDPQDKKVIVCDEKLKNVFAGKERVGFLEIAGLISPHFMK